jgi:hypothetical protein
MTNLTRKYMDKLADAIRKREAQDAEISRY